MRALSARSDSTSGSRSRPHAADDRMDIDPAEIALDACSLLNLIATRRIGEIAQAVLAIFVAERRAANEVHYIRRGGSGPDALDREAIDLVALETDGFLVIYDLTKP